MNVIVVAPDPAWRAQYSLAAQGVWAAMGGNLLRLHHIGSTSIPGIFAKPIIDMLAEVADIAQVDASDLAMRNLGYEPMGEFGIPGRRYFRRDDASGRRTHQIRAFQAGSPDAVRHLVFRDYLRAHADIANQYSQLKQDLASKHPQDIEAYMDGKDPFIKGIEADALVWNARTTP